MGRAGVRVCLQAGVNDLGGTLMDESISRSAGASHGQEMNPAEMEATIIAAGRIPRQRTTTYNDIARRSRSPCRRRECASRRTFADARHG